MREEEFYSGEKKTSPAQCFVEQITDLLSDEMVSVPTDYAHTSNYFWKEIASFLPRTN